MNNKKRFFIFLLTGLLFLIFSNSLLAQEWGPSWPGEESFKKKENGLTQEENHLKENSFSLELEYPAVPAAPRLKTVSTLPDFVIYIFNFAIMIGGLLAFLMILIGGVRYLISAGNPAAINDARDQIFSALLGLIILLASWIILNVINPQLVTFRPILTPPGL